MLGGCALDWARLPLDELSGWVRLAMDAIERKGGT